MPRHFNTAGLCFPQDHYMVDPLKRLSTIEGLIEEKKYFVIHAPRQTGKTTAMRALMEKLNREGKYIAVHFSCESASVTGEKFELGNRYVTESLVKTATIYLPENERPPELQGVVNDGTLLNTTLARWAAEQQKPIVLLIDEIDSLSDLTLISILRQLRDGYQNRPGEFPQSVALIGLKDVRDYKVKVRDELKTMGTASPFNIKDESLTLRNFTSDEVFELLQQHTQETGQGFTQEALESIFFHSQGQPWLVNALAKQCVQTEGKHKTTATIDIEDVYAAKEKLILRRDTHLDSLFSQLAEERVQRILTPILEGELLPFDILDDDLQYVRDLGLIRTDGRVRIANPIYQEVIPRSLNFKTQITIPEEYDTWLDDEEKLNWPKIWDQFIEFWREIGEPLIAAQHYPEVAPHLVLMAYLQRIANAKGQIIREYAIGRKRMDLLVRWPYEKDGKRQWQLEAIELKVWKQSDKKNPLPKGLKQLTAYLNGLSLNEGTLIIFDRREGLPDLEDRVEREFIEHENKRIQLIHG